MKDKTKEHFRLTLHKDESVLYVELCRVDTGTDGWDWYLALPTNKELTYINFEVTFEPWLRF